MYFPAADASSVGAGTTGQRTSSQAAAAAGAGAGMPTYWEGAVTVSGAPSGVGYVELTGYAGR
jgi:predicted secreted hydrolase